MSIKKQVEFTKTFIELLKEKDKTILAFRVVKETDIRKIGQLFRELEYIKDDSYDKFIEKLSKYFNKNDKTYLYIDLLEKNIKLRQYYDDVNNIKSFIGFFYKGAVISQYMDRQIFDDFECK